MITLHHLENSRSQRVLWLLEELALPYKVQHYKRNPKTMLAPPELERVHPLGKSPVISDGKTVVAESGAIIEYLLEAHGEGRLKPAAGTPEARRFTYWLHFAEGSAMPPLLMKLVFAKIPSAVPFFIKPVAKAIAAGVNAQFIDPNLLRQIAFMEAELKDHGPWFAGSAFSAADIQMSFPVEAADASGALGEKAPTLQDWLTRIHARAAYRRALEVGGPYSVTPR